VRRSLILRGIPDANVVDGGQFSPIAGGLSTTFINALNNYIAALKQTFLPGALGVTFGIRKLDPAAPVAFIVNAVAAAGGYVQVTTSLATGYVGATPIVIRGRGIPTALKGRHTAFPTGANTFQIASPYLLTPYTGFAIAVKLQFVYAPYTSITGTRIVTRNSGRPFGLPVGRKKPVRLTF
jgi:hypothetical protein